MIEISYWVARPVLSKVTGVAPMETTLPEI